MDIDAWKTINRLVEHALDLPPAERTTWVDDLGPEYEAFKPRLRAMLERLASTGAFAFLETLPKWTELPGESSGASAGDPAVGAMVGPYRLVRELAAGGQGRVWLADRPDGLIDRPVAIKLPAGMADRRGLAERMARERAILARLTHPHIARLYDAGVTDAGQPFLALEYVEGSAIDRHVAERGLSVPATLGLFEQVIDAVAYAHGQLVIHRDIKPSNVIVTPEGEARLLDFGIAKLLDGGAARDSTVTTAAGRALTLAYASPEQVAHEALGVATDVYSLGVLLYELLCGRRPYTLSRDTIGALEEAILHGEPTRPSDAASIPARRAALRGDLDTILLKALQKRPADRYPTVSAFGDDLTRYRDGRPVAAQPDRAGYRARKFVARHRLAVGASAAVLVAVLGGAGTSAWQARVARAERDRADAVKEFIASIFRDIDPNLRGGDWPLTAVDVLAQARERLDWSLVAEPAVRAELLRVLGDSFFGVGDPRSAADVLSRALPETKRLWGERSREAIATELSLAQAEHYLDRVDEANAHIEGALDALERTGQRDTEPFVDAALLRTEILLNHGKAGTPDAEAAASLALEAATRILPERHAKRAKALQMLSVVYRSRSKNEEALAPAEEAYRLLLDLHGGDGKQIDVITAQNDYGRALFQAGRTREAIIELKEAASRGRESLGDNPVLLQHLYGTLANVQLAYGEIKDAVANFEFAISLDLRGVKLSPTYLASQHVVRGRAFLAARRPADALAAYERAIDGYTRAGDTAVATLLRSERAEALVRLGRLAEAEADLTPIAAHRGTEMTPAVRRAVWLLGDIFRRRQQLDRALPLLREAAAFDPVTGRSRLDKAEFQVSLGLASLDRGALEAARETLTQAVAAFAANQGAMTPAHAEALVALARVHLAAGRPDDARPLVEQANAFWTAFDPRHAEALRAARLLGVTRTVASARP